MTCKICGKMIIMKMSQTEQKVTMYCENGHIAVEYLDGTREKHHN